MDLIFGNLSVGRCICDFCRRNGSGNQQCRWPMGLGNCLGRRRRRRFARSFCHSFLANNRGRRMFELLEDPAQRSRCLSQRELHVLRLRRPDDLHRERIRRHQLCRAHVGRLSGPSQSAVSRQWEQDAWVHQSKSLFDWRSFELRLGFPRHHQWQQRRLGNHRLRPGNRLGESER